jgi:hypothetical protein
VDRKLNEIEALMFWSDDGKQLSAFTVKHGIYRFSRVIRTDAGPS